MRAVVTGCSATILFASLCAVGVKSWRALQVAAGDGPDHAGAIAGMPAR
jgi:hypothetical protein